MPQQPAVTLISEDRTILETFVHRGKANARTLTRDRILLKSADGWSTGALADAFAVCEATVTNVQRRFADGDWRRSYMIKCSSIVAAPTPATDRSPDCCGV